MINIATIYRFNTPFLDLEKEKRNLLSVVKKIKKSLEFDGLLSDKKVSRDETYYKATFDFVDSLGKIEIFYLNDISDLEYFLPIFKLNIFIDNKFLVKKDLKVKLIGFLNNIFECFDGLNEKEFLIDIDNRVFYKKSFFRKVGPSYDFSDLEYIKNKFESKDGMKLVEDFIKKFSDKEFILTKEKSDYYHTLHGIFLYFIYLVFLMYQNIERTKNTKKVITKDISNDIFKGHIDLMEKRLSYVEDLHNVAFDKYNNRLELFFKMF